MEKLENDMAIGDPLTYSWKFRRSYTCTGLSTCPEKALEKALISHLCHDRVTYNLTYDVRHLWLTSDSTQASGGL